MNTIIIKKKQYENYVKSIERKNLRDKGSSRSWVSVLNLAVGEHIVQETFLDSDNILVVKDWKKKIRKLFELRS